MAAPGSQALAWHAPALRACSAGRLHCAPHGPPPQRYRHIAPLEVSRARRACGPRGQGRAAAARCASSAAGAAAGGRRRRAPRAHLHGDLAAVGHADADVDPVQAAARGLLLHEVQPERLGHVRDLRRAPAQFRVRARPASGARGCRSRRRGEARTERVRVPALVAWWGAARRCGLAHALTCGATGLWCRAGPRACRRRASQRSHGMPRRPDRLY